MATTEPYPRPLADISTFRFLAIVLENNLASITFSFWNHKTEAIVNKLSVGLFVGINDFIAGNFLYTQDITKP